MPAGREVRKFTHRQHLLHDGFSEFELFALGRRLLALGQDILGKRDRRAAVGLGGQRERLFLHAADPGLVARRRALERGRHHGQAAHHLAALEQQIAERRLRAGMALLGGKLQPAGGLANARSLRRPRRSTASFPTRTGRWRCGSWRRRACNIPARRRHSARPACRGCPISCRRRAPPARRRRSFPRGCRARRPAARSR